MKTWLHWILVPLIAFLIYYLYFSHDRRELKCSFWNINYMRYFLSTHLLPKTKSNFLFLSNFSFLLLHLIRVFYPSCAVGLSCMDANFSWNDYCNCSSSYSFFFFVEQLLFTLWLMLVSMCRVNCLFMDFLSTHSCRWRTIFLLFWFWFLVYR